MAVTEDCVLRHGIMCCDNKFYHHCGGTCCLHHYVRWIVI